MPILRNMMLSMVLMASTHHLQASSSQQLDSSFTPHVTLANENSANVLEQPEAGDHQTSLSMSRAGALCLTHLKRGGDASRSLVISTAVASLSLATATAGLMLLVAPTLAAAAVIGAVGSLGVVDLSHDATLYNRQHQEFQHRGQLIEASYMTLGLLPATAHQSWDALARVASFGKKVGNNAENKLGHKHLRDANSLGQVSTLELAEHIVRLNETGAFCAAKVIAPGLSNPAALANAGTLAQAMPASVLAEAISTHSRVSDSTLQAFQAMAL